MKGEWFEEERRRSFGNELSRLRRRALRRPIITFFLAAFAAAIAVLNTARKPRTFTARVVFRVAEKDVAVGGGSPRPKSNLREYVWDAAFSTERLMGVVKKHNLYMSAMRLDPSLALEAMRDDIDVDVFRNYFLEERTEDSAPPTARLVITYTSVDAELALLIARELGDIVIDYEAQNRRELTQFAVQDAEQIVKQEQAQLTHLTERISDAQLRLETARPVDRPSIQAEVSGLYRSIPAAESRVKQAQTQARNLRLRAAFERNQSGLQFELIDAASVSGIQRSQLSQLILVGALALLFALPLAARAVGAFDSRVYDGDDASRLGLKVLGHVPAFRGDQMASLRRRLDAQDRVR
jgi:hypothetical protein